MNRIGVVVLAFAAGVGVVCASEPGEPLDCADWVVVYPGVNMEPFLPFLDYRECGSVVGVDYRCHGLGSERTGVDGAIYQWKPNSNFNPGECFHNKRRYEIWRMHRDGSSELVAFIEDRCGPGEFDEHDGVMGINFSIDNFSGDLLISMRSQCHEYDCHATRYDLGYTACKIRGLPTTFDVLQTYDPPGTSIGFRVPYMPEGMDAVDWFDTFWGSLASVGDWSQAQPLQCGYPATPPAVGDFLTAADTLPEPDPGQGYYYVTAATYMGETRYGRQASGGVLSGRDPAVLPACE